MAFKDRFRRALTRSSTTTRSNSLISSSSSNGASTNAINPTSTNTSSATPDLNLTKSSSRLSKTLTFRSDKNKKTKEEKRREEWEEADRKGPGQGRQHQEILRAFEWKGAWRSSLDGWGRRGSGISGVSPGGSRVGSVDSAATGGPGVRRMASGNRRVSSQSIGGLERVRSGDVETVIEE